MKPPRAFRSAAAFRAWLERNHDKSTELVLRCYKVHAKQKGVTYPEALDEALCFGWIDGVRRAYDAESFTQRFTPRRRGSNWSAVNIRRAKMLEAEGRMHPAGLIAFRARQKGEGGRAPSAAAPWALDASALKQLRANRQAWEWYEKRPPGFRRLCAAWVMSARREETRAKRLAMLIEYAALGEVVPPMRWLERKRR